MAATYLLRRLFPSVLVFAALICAALAADWGMHALGFESAGRWLGPVGTGLLAVSFLHSLRKRRMIAFGSPKGLLLFHEVLGWVGSLLLLVHAGVHFNAWVPWLAVVALVVAVASGLTGKYLLADARAALAGRKKDLAAEGHAPAEVERRLQVLALLTGSMQKWRAVHLPITAVFAGLALVHVVATLLLWSGWAG